MQRTTHICCTSWWIGDVEEANCSKLCKTRCQYIWKTHHLRNASMSQPQEMCYSTWSTKEARLAHQISTASFILQKLEADIIIQHVSAAKDMCLGVKLMYQQGRIRKYRCKSHHPAHSLSRGRGRSPVESKANIEALCTRWKAEGLTAVDTNEYLDQEMQEADMINENLLECMGRCSILAVCLYNLARHVGSQRRIDWERIHDAAWLKEVIEIKKERPFFEDIIGIRK